MSVWPNALVVKSGFERFYECYRTRVHTLRYFSSQIGGRVHFENCNDFLTSSHFRKIAREISAEIHVATVLYRQLNDVTRRDFSRGKIISEKYINLMD